MRVNLSGLLFLLLLTLPVVVVAEELPVAEASGHQLSDGTFTNTDGQAINKSLGDLWRAFAGKEKPQAVALPVSQVDPEALRHPTQSQMVWLGHSTFLLQLGDMTILTDPQFSRRASPVFFAGPERVTGLPLDPSDLPQIDAVVISHNHYDHLDTASVKALRIRQPDNPPHFFVPLGLADWFRDRGIPEVTELDWWQSATLGDTRFYAVPVKHWSARGLFDRNRTLWAGWVMDSPGQRLMHVGDSGYSDDFRRIGECFPGIDMALIPIGAYDPRWFMKDAHMNPEEAVQVFQDMGAVQAVGMHWGTFILTFEAMTEPPQRLHRAVTEAGLAADRFTVMQPGEIRGLSSAGEPADPVCDITPVMVDDGFR